MSGEREEIVFGGGCFWCIEAVFRRVKGVEKVVPGYAGGWKENPTYEEVCTGRTGHAEVVRIVYDPEVVSLEELLEIFFEAHDPTSRERQGPDEGPQYRSIILVTSEDQEERVHRFIRKKQPEYEKPIVTEVKRLDRFYEAEDYHKGFFERNPEYPYCRVYIRPKLEKLATKKLIERDVDRRQILS